MRVLITRPQPDAEIFANLCRARGLLPVTCPLMSVQFEKCDVALDDIGALAFTSANGVRAFAHNCAERNLPVFAVGEVSAKAARTEGFENIHIAGGDVAALATCITQARSVFAGSVLHIAGSRRAGDLVGALEANGVLTRRQVLYGTEEASVLPDDALEALSGALRAQWVTLFSPRSAVVFVKLIQLARIEKEIEHCRVVCLSQAVADEAGLLKWKSVETAAGPNVAAMIELMVKT